MAEPILIDGEIALRALDECVKERGPSYVYRAVVDAMHTKQCLYWHPDDTPGCIVGLALHKLGVPKEHLTKWNWCGVGLALPEMNSDGVTNCTATAQQILQSVQVDQDNGVTWGEAVARVRKDYENNNFREFAA